MPNTHRPLNLGLSRPARALPALVLSAFALAASIGSAQAQVIVRPFYYGGTWSGPMVMPVPQGPERLSINEIYAEIGDQGYRALGLVSRTRDTVVVDAVDSRQRRIRLTVDAYDGEILARRALATARAEPPRGPLARPAPEREDAEPPPARRKSVEAPKARPALPPAASPTPTTPEGSNPASKPAPVAPARDPSQWGKEG